MGRTSRVAEHVNRTVRRRWSALSNSVTDAERRKRDWYPPTVCAGMGWSALTGAVATVVIWLTWAGMPSSLDDAGFVLLLAVAGSMFGVLVGVVAISISATARAIARLLSASRPAQAAAGAIALLFCALAGGVLVLLPFASDGAEVVHGVVFFMSLLDAVGYYLRVTERIPWWSRPIADLDRPPR